MKSNILPPCLCSTFNVQYYVQNTGSIIIREIKLFDLFIRRPLDARNIKQSLQKETFAGTSFRL